MRLTRTNLDPERERKYLEHLDIIATDPRMLQLARALQRAAFPNDPFYKKEGFVPAPLYAEQAVSIFNDVNLKAVIRSCIE